MTAHTTSSTGSAGRWGPLGGSRPVDWATSEDQQTPTYEAALARVALLAGQRSSTSAAVSARFCVSFMSVARSCMGSTRPRR